MRELSLDRALIAVEKVRERLLRTTAALERHGVPYAVIGGNAVAVWVARIDEDAVRNTVDVDILLRREDLPKAAVALAEVGFEPAEVQDIPVFIETASPSVKRGVHVIFANEKVRPRDAHPAPDVSQVTVANEGFKTIELRPLLVMKLTSNRLKDQVHVQDMLELEMIGPELEATLSADLRDRLNAIKAAPR